MKSTIDQLIINSPYKEPEQYWSYDRETRSFTLKTGSGVGAIGVRARMHHRYGRHVRSIRVRNIRKSLPDDELDIGV